MVKVTGFEAAASFGTGTQRSGPPVLVSFKAQDAARAKGHTHQAGQVLLCSWVCKEALR